MSLRNEQTALIEDIVQLLSFAKSKGFTYTLGEAYRTPEQQKIYLEIGKTKTADSYHLKRLALDINFFKGDIYITDKSALQEIGNFWESLNPINSWGGNWKSFLDTPHFERRAK